MFLIIREKTFANNESVFSIVGQWSQITMQEEKMKREKIKLPDKLKRMGFKKIHQDKDGFFMFSLTPSKLKKGGKDVYKK